jgi:predicted transcriptional regulator
MATGVVPRPVNVMPNTRRIVLAVSAGALVLVAGLAAAGLANASGSELPETFRIAERRGGDKGEYRSLRDVPEATYEAEPGSGSGGSGGGALGTVQMEASASFESNEGAMSFEWLPEQAWRTGDGTWHAVHGKLVVHEGSAGYVRAGDLEVEIPNWSIDWHETAIGLVLGHTSVGGGSAMAQGSTFSGSESRVSVDTITTWATEVPCELGDRLRAGVRLDEPIVASGCLDDAVAFRAVGLEDVGDIQAVRFEATGRSMDHGEEVEVTLSYWYNPGIPEPVRKQVQADGEVVSDWALVSFEAGDEPWDTGVDLPAGGDLPEPVLAPRQSWGPDDAGVDHPFPLSDAWRRARDDVVFRDFGEFLARHPEAAAVHTRYSEGHDGSSTTRWWSLHVAADGASFYLDAWQEEMYAAGAVTDLLGRDPVGPPVHAYRFSGGEGGDMGIDLASLPAKLPTADSGQKFWQAFVGSAEPGNMYALEYGMPLGHAGMHLRAGRDVYEAPEGNGNFTSTSIVLDPEGRAVALWQRDTRYTSTAASMQPGMQAETKVHGASAGFSERKSSAPVSLSAVPIEATASASVLAVLSGLLVWLWPAIKSTPALGLFSRLREDKLLAHPARARIMARVEAQPGIHYQELLRAEGGGKGSLEHHLRKLEAGRLVRAVRGPYYTCYFPWSASPAARDAAPVLKSEGARRVLAAVRAHPGLTGQELAARTGLSASSVSEHVSRLASAGLLQSSRQGRTVRVVPTGAAAGLQAAA